MDTVDSYDSLAHDLPDSWVTSLIDIGCPIDQPDKGDSYILCVACEHLQPENVKLALSVGANPNCQNFESNTPLLCAIDVSHLNPVLAFEIVEMLLAAGANIEIRGYMDKTPFLKACTRGCLDILKLLISSGCDIHAVTWAPDNFNGIDCATTFDNSPVFKAYVLGLYDA